MKEKQKFHTVRGYQLLQQNKNLLTSGMEDYLEMVYRNSLKEGYLRISKLAELLNVQASSATKMVQKLTRLGLLRYQKYGIIQLTESGKEIGEFLLSRHKIIEKFLKLLGADEEVLVETELIEHNISVDTLQNIDLLNKFMEEEPEFKEKFDKYKNDLSENS